MNEIFNSLKELGFEVPSIVVAFIILIVGAFAIIYKIIIFLHKLYEFINKRYNAPWRQKQIDEILRPDYSSQIAERKFFIPTKFISYPPHNMDDPSEVERIESAKTAIDHFLNKVFVQDNTTQRFFCVLSGSGMGKTTFLVNLVIEYINKYNKKNCPFHIRILSLSESDIFDKIRNIPEPNKTILFLDALDENAEACDNIDSFLEHLETNLCEFRFVVLTSRTQFFPSEKEEPHETAIINKAGVKGFHKYVILYLSPFSDEDVQAYLRKKYKKTSVRKKANKIIEKCSSLMTRPMLLSHMDDLLKNEPIYTTSLSVYTALINAWIEREVSTCKESERHDMYDKLKQFSIDFAKHLFKARCDKNSMRISKDEYKTFLEEKGYDTYNFTERSLINRDIVGDLKFSHKSFYEYFLAMAKIQDPSWEIPISGFDNAWEFYRLSVRDKYGDIIKELCLPEITPEHKGLIECSQMVLKNNVQMDLLYLNGIYNITKIKISAKMLADENFQKWHSSSDVKNIIVENHCGENLMPLLACPNVVSVIIISNRIIRNKSIHDFLMNAREKGIIVKFIERNAYYYRRLIIN